MAGMMASDRNRGILSVDNRFNDDGFWTLRKFHGKRRTGAATGGRGWRRTLRAKEKSIIRRSITSDQM